MYFLFLDSGCDNWWNSFERKENIFETRGLGFRELMENNMIIYHWRIFYCAVM